MLTSFADRGPTADDNVWHDFRRQTLRAAVNALPAKQRQALSLAFFDELTHEQVAAALDVPLGTAKTRIRSAIESLRGQLTPLRASLLVGLFLMAGLMWQHQQSQRLDQERRAPLARNHERRHAGSAWKRSPVLIRRLTPRIAAVRRNACRDDVLELPARARRTRVPRLGAARRPVDGPG